MQIKSVDANQISNFPILCRQIAEGADKPELRQMADMIGKLADHLQALETRISNPRPMDLIFVRHGYSEANHAKRLIKENKISEELEKKINNYPDNRFRLTAQGRQQAVNTGLWLKQNLNFKLDVCYVSDFCRAQETAAILGEKLELEVPWRINVFLGERNWGDFPNLPQELRKEEERKRIANPRHWRPPVVGGQSLRELETTLRIGLMSLFTSHHNEAVLATGHGEQIIACMDIIEKLPEKLVSKLLADGIPNGGIVHYSRCCPETGAVDKNFRWRRLVDPSNSERHKKRWNGNWQRISRPTFTTEELLQLSAEHPVLLDGV